MNLHNSPLREYCYYSCCRGRWQGHSVVWNWPMSREVVSGQKWSCRSVSRIFSPVNCPSTVWAATGRCRSVLGLPEQYHKLGGLNNRNVFFHSSGVGCPRSRYEQGDSFWGPGKGSSSRPLSELLVVAGHLWCSLACRHITMISAFIFVWPSFCARLCPNFLFL